MNNIKLERVKQIIDEWNPIDLLPLAPSDEYDYETEKIYNLIKDKTSIDKNKLARIIFDVFRNTFGEDVFLKTESECETIAESILQITKI